MKWFCTKVNELSRKLGVSNVTLFIVLSMAVCGITGCAVAVILDILPVLGHMTFAKLLFICAGYGMFLVGMLGSAVYLLINEPLSER